MIDRLGLLEVASTLSLIINTPLPHLPTLIA